MKIGLFATTIKPQAAEIKKEVDHFLTERSMSVVDIKTNTTAEELQACDLIITIGGDGSLLHFLHLIGIPNIPIVGINFGSLGFLADISVQNIFEGLEAICQGSYKASERIVLEGVLQEKTIGFAVNEVVIHRGCHPHIVDLALHIDGTFVNTFSADGLIIATPSGSTAYSLSSGGPIVSPEIEAYIITPISPHTLSNRPLVLMPKHSLTIELWRGPEYIDIAFDGQPPIALPFREPLEITKSSHCFTLLSLLGSNYFATLRTKLGWTGSLRQ